MKAEQFMGLTYEQLTVFVVSDGKPIVALVMGGTDGRAHLDGTHPALKELWEVFSGTTSRGVLNACVLNVVTPGH
jgi:hypothetical protein